MNNQEAILLYTMLNTQNSQLSCFIPSISLKPFPHLAHSICHLSLHPLFIPLLCYASCILFLPLPSFSTLCCFSKCFLSFSPFPTPSLSTCPLQPYSHPNIHLRSPSEPSLSLSLSLSVYPCSVRAVPATLCSQYPLI